MNKKESKLTGLMAMMVFALFAICLLLVLLSGANTYRSLVDRGEAGNRRRTAALYVTTRVRQADAVRLEPFGDGEALVLEESGYLTRVYCHDGWLRELYTAGSGSFSPADGEKILEAQELTFSVEEGLLRGTLTLEAEDPLVLMLHIPGEQEGSP